MPEPPDPRGESVSEDDAAFETTVRAAPEPLAPPPGPGQGFVSTLAATGGVVGVGPRPKPTIHPGGLLSDRYTIDHELGSGGMGQVYLGTDTRLSKKVAIKVLQPWHRERPGMAERFLREAKAASTIQHPNIVQVTDFGETPAGEAFMVMEFLEGQDLGELIAGGEPLPWSRIRPIMRQLLDALGAAHAKGIIHRDVKPDNCLLVSRKHGEDFVKVLDFGIAKVVDPNASALTNTGAVMGTAHYMAPEQARGEVVDARSDLYSAGVVLFEMLTGKPLFDGKSPMSVAHKHMSEPARRPTTVAPERTIHPDLDDIVLRALQKEPEKRFQTAEEFVQALKNVSDEPVARRSRLPLVLAAGIGGLVIAGAATMLGEFRDQAATRSEPIAAVGVGAPRDAQPPPAPRVEETPARAEVPAALSDAPRDDATAKPAPDPGSPRSSRKHRSGEKPKRTKPTPKPVTSSTSQAKLQDMGKRCLQAEGAFPGESVTVRFSVSATGTAKNPRFPGQYRGTPLAKCIVKGLQAATFSTAGEPTRKLTFRL